MKLSSLMCCFGGQVPLRHEIEGRHPAGPVVAVDPRTPEQTPVDGSLAGSFHTLEGWQARLRRHDSASSVLSAHAGAVRR